MVPFDQPEAALVSVYAQLFYVLWLTTPQDLFTRWITDVPLTLNVSAIAEDIPFGGWA